MAVKTFEHSLCGLCQRTPFQPFTVELVSGGRFTVDHPEAIVFRAGLAVFINPNGMPTLFADDVSAWGGFLASRLEETVVGMRQKPVFFMRAENGQQDGPANRSQPCRSEPNRTSPAAGSRR